MCTESPQNSCECFINLLNNYFDYYKYTDKDLYFNFQNPVIKYH